MKYAIVTGGAKGIGRCITEYMIKDGYAVFVIDLDDEAGKQLSTMCGVDKCLFYPGDTGNQEDNSSSCRYSKREHRLSIYPLRELRCLKKIPKVTPVRKVESQHLPMD